MPAIDHEAEYNNRARVPEHPEIFERWTREAEAFRAEAAAESRAELDISYGASPRQIIDLFAPAGGVQGPFAMFLHGGYWRSLEPKMFSHMARGLNARGICVAVIGYDLCPKVRITDIVGQIQQACLYLWRRFGRRILVSGHSAGGHLATCMLATDWKGVAPDAPADLVPCAYSVSGVFDLEPLLHVSMNAELRLDEAEVRAISPLAWPVAPGRVLDAVVGALESAEFLRQSRTITESWRQAGAETRYEEVPGTNHFSVLDAMAQPDSPMAARLVALAERTQATMS
jgi:arylformamidase